MYANNHILFPYEAIASLRQLRGPVWQSLVNEILSLPETHERTLAFMLMLIRMNGCLSCETDSYRAMRGCDLCAQQTLRRFKGEDSELVELFEDALQDVRRFARKSKRFTIIQSEKPPANSATTGAIEDAATGSQSGD